MPKTISQAGFLNNQHNVFFQIKCCHRANLPSCLQDLESYPLTHIYIEPISPERVFPDIHSDEVCSCQSSTIPQPRPESTHRNTRKDGTDTSLPFLLLIYLILALLGLFCSEGFCSSCSEPGPLRLCCAGFPLQALLLQQSAGSAVRGLGCVARALERRLSSGTWAQLLCSKCDLPRPGIEPMSPALAGGFLSTELPGKLHHQLSKSPSGILGTVRW